MTADARLRAEGPAPATWSGGPGDRFAAHDHPYDKVIVVASGSITFGVPPGSRNIVLRAGDRLELPAGTLHDAVVGPGGVTCLETHLPAGALAARPDPTADQTTDVVLSSGFERRPLHVPIETDDTSTT